MVVKTLSVAVSDVEANSPAEKAGIKAGDRLLKIGKEEIMDVLDYRFYQNARRLSLEVETAAGKHKKIRIKKDEYEELGLLFDTYLMDEKRSCKNKCVFCFIDQLPPGLRESLYFKDDDSRLSFLFGNYITLTNITEHEIARIIKMHISPINISVHTTNPELRVKMMTNKNAGAVLSVIDRLNAAGIRMNCQLVLCPGWNDGAELERSLRDLTALEMVECIAAVPVGLTKFRDGLTPLEPFDRKTAGDVLDVIDRFGDECMQKYGERRVYGADEFYLMSHREIPPAEYYGDFLQLENGVGLWALLRSEVEEVLAETEPVLKAPRKISIATGVSAAPLLREIADRCQQKCPQLSCTVYPIVNHFFGERITVAGLVTATDLIEQLQGKDLGEALLIPSSMLRAEGDLFLDSISLTEVSEKLGVPVIPTDNSGEELVCRIFGTEDSYNGISI
ncbi:MAG: DUF512 domain-containing protein [Clostridia bacterium]|nr:DUF512 domain-containing protein [Clostridia bacterium]